MSPSFLPEAMKDSARTRRLALIGALAVLSLVTVVTGGVTPPADVAYAQSSSSCGGPSVYFYESAEDSGACSNLQPAFCDGPKDNDEVWDAGSIGMESCAADFKDSYGYCPPIGEQNQYDFCAIVCCAAEGVGYIDYGECPESDPPAESIIVNLNGEIDPDASCGYSSSSSYSSSSDPPLCGNGEIDTYDGEQCDDGSYCTLGYFIGSAEDMESCMDDGGNAVTESGDGCDEGCQLEPVYCCYENEREAVDSEALQAFAEWVGGGDLSGYYCADIDSSRYIYSDSNLTETTPDVPCLCGDGEVQEGEQCDLGEGRNTDAYGCPDCTVSCGNYVPDDAYVVDWGGVDWAYGEEGDILSEQCDDGNWDSLDGCSEYCQYEPIWYCSRYEDGARIEVPEEVRSQVSVGYVCDNESDPNLPDCYGTVTAGEYDSCDCGDGIVQYNEQCDLGVEYNKPEEGCSESCEWICGNGTVDDAYIVTWEGDDWVTDDNGDYLVEECDDGNGDNSDGCSEYCQWEPGLCCFNPADWPEYGYFEYLEDQYTGEEVDSEYCDYYGGTYFDSEMLSGDSRTLYEICEIPGVCCPSDGSTPYQIGSSEDCYGGDYIDAETLLLGDWYGDPYDANGDGAYDDDEASRACNENGVCCYDLDDDGQNDTYDYPTDEYDVDREYCDEQGGVFTPLSAMDPEDPSEFCGIQGICCYPDGSQDFSDREPCEEYFEVDENDELVYAEFVPYDDVNTTDDYELTEDEINAACNENGVCCYDDDGDGTNDSFDEGVPREYCEFWAPYSEFHVAAEVSSQDPAEYCEIPGVCCYEEGYYEGSDPERLDQETCEGYQGHYYTFAEAEANGDYTVDEEEMANICEYKGLCCIDNNEDELFDTYREDYTQDECDTEWEGRWTPNYAIPDEVESYSEFCPIVGVCCPSGQSQSFAPFQTDNQVCSYEYKGNYLTFDEVNDNGDDELDPQEIKDSCDEPGYCCNALDMQTEEVMGRDACETPEKFRPTSGATDLNEDEEITWDEACAQYCCYANAAMEDSEGYEVLYDLEPVNVSAEYPDEYINEGDDCQAVTGDLSMIGEVSLSDQYLCTMYCCDDDGLGTRIPVPIDDIEQQAESCVTLGYTGGDEWGSPVLDLEGDGEAACDYDEPVVCCTLEGQETTFEEGELQEGDDCQSQDEYDCDDPESRDNSLCYQEMSAVLAEDRQTSSDGSEPEPLCQFYCCDSYGKPYSNGVDQYSACEDQNDDYGEPLAGGDNGMPTPIEDDACPWEPVYCCEGGETVVVATDDGTEEGNPLEDGEGKRIEVGDNCANFGNFESFPGHDYYTSDYACDYYCCDAETEEQVPVYADDYTEAQEVYDTNYPTCQDIAELTGSDWQEGEVGPPTSCDNPTLYCCEGDEGGPTGVIVPAWKNNEDVSVGNQYDDDGNLISKGCYGPNPTRSYSDSGLSCCEGSPEACESPTFCTSFSLFEVFDIAACNPTACSAVGCQPSYENNDFVDFVLDATENPWNGGVMCNVCNAASNPDDQYVYVCDGGGWYSEVSPIDAIGLDPLLTTADAEFWCQLVNYDVNCAEDSWDTLQMANYYGVPFYTDGYCRSSF